MRVDLRDGNRKRIGRIEVDPAARPTRVNVEPRGFGLASIGSPLGTRNGSTATPHADSRQPIAESLSREVFLDWETAIDDAGQLRRCVACGCPDLFREKSFPQVTGFVVLLAFIGAIVGALGLATNLPVLLAMASVLVLDIAILVLSRRRLVCYRCRTTFYDLPIARYHRSWDRGVADRYPAPLAAVETMKASGVERTTTTGLPTPSPASALPAKDSPA